jgi:hypothetical protein
MPDGKRTRSTSIGPSFERHPGSVSSSALDVNTTTVTATITASNTTTTVTSHSNEEDNTGLWATTMDDDNQPPGQR